MFSLLCAPLRWQWQRALWTSGRCPGDIRRPRPLFGLCLVRSRLRAELLPHPQRVPRGRGVHAGLSQHRRRGGTHRARRAGGANGDHGVRLRLARDLHDRLLPSLTGTALPLETARRRVETDSQTVGGSLIDIQGLLAAKQRALRTLLRQLEPDRPAAPGQGIDVFRDLCVSLAMMDPNDEKRWGSSPRAAHNAPGSEPRQGDAWPIGDRPLAGRLTRAQWG